MQNQEDKSSPASDKPGFLGMPRGVRIWAEAGPRFWAGVVLGIALGLAFGLVFGGGLVRQGLKSDTTLAGIGLVAIVVGIWFAQWTIGRTAGRK
ncbi:MAG TPA: hypothetical protein VGK58_23180 [Lacipirellulaceae bacterium]